jgi:type VI secretion system protein ImpL
MAAVRRFVLSRWFLTGLGVLLLALLVWFVGPLLAFLESWIVRAAIIAVMVLIWALANWWVGRRRRRADDALAAGLVAKPSGPDVAGEEVAAVGEKLSEALAVLKKARGTRGYLYEQPWYVIIGPPGAGKTTALINSGLSFPLAADMGQGGRPGAIAGVGGTRLCEWWFTDDAVLIDTAGRYTTQDSDSEVDRAGWRGFLALLKRSRPRQPLNGVLVAISVADIMVGRTDMLAHAAAIRARVKELNTSLGVQLPIYVLFTKSDLIAGFTEFFADLDREKREQVWGTTFPLRRGEAGVGPVAGFREQHAALLERVENRVLDRLQAERSPERRQLIAGFPAQVASLADPMDEFLLAAFGGSRLDPAPLLRGVYLTSGTQNGTPIDRLTGAMAQAFGMRERRLPSLVPEQGRSYFVKRLLRQVVFGEAMLVSEPPGAARRRVLLRVAAFAGVALVTLGLSGALLVGRSAAQSDTNLLGAALVRYQASAAGLPLDPVSDSDLPRILPLLDQSRDLPFGATSQAGGFTPGLSQSAKLGTAARLVYRHALERVLLPRLVFQLESQMRGALNRPGFLYEATRVYLMLGSQGPLDRDLVRDWMAADWASTYSGATRAPIREDLARHLDALLSEPLPAISLDGQLVEDARRTFSRVTLAERVYSRIRPSAAARRIPAWIPADVLGSSGQRVFTRPSGKPMTEGVPGFFTVQGFHRVLLPSLASTAREVVSESWVLGNRPADASADPAMLTLERDVVALYCNDYAKVWDAMLADIAVVPLRDLQSAVQDLYVLASPQSPMRDLLTSIVRQLTLSVPPPAPPGAAGVVAAATNAATQASPRLAGMFDQGSAPAAPPGQAIDDRYRALRDYVGNGPGAPIDITLKLLNDLQQQLAALAGAAAGGTAPAVATGPDPGQMLRAEAYRQPPPVSGWLQTLASTGDRLRGGGAKQQAAAAFNGPSGPASLCKQAVDGRYPFKPDSPRDIPLDDFAKLFAPGGLMDAFFSQQLRAFVDQSPAGWKLQPVGGVEPPISAADLAQFQRAATIRDLFFSAGGATPSVRFEITPVSSDPGTKQVTLDLNGIAIVDVHGPARATQVVWPGPQGMGTVRLVFDPPPSSGPPVIQTTGPWALFRMFNQGKLEQQAGAEIYQLSFHFGDRQAVFQIRAGSVNNPFSPGVLQSFACPQIQ